MGQFITLSHVERVLSITPILDSSRSKAHIHDHDNVLGIDRLGWGKKMVGGGSERLVISGAGA